MDQVVLDGTSIANEAAGYFVSTPIDGLGAPSKSTTQYDRSGADGIRITNQFDRGRLVSVRGFIKATCGSDHAAQRRVMASLFRKSKIAGVLQDKTLRLVDFDGSDYTIEGQIVDSSMPKSDPKYSRYQFQFLAKTPEIPGTTEKTATVTVSTGGSLSIPLSLPVSFEGGVDGSQTITNAGDEVAWPIITLNGPLTNPRITNADTEEYLQLNLTISSGNSVVVDMRNRTVIQNGSLNQISKVTELSTWWSIDPGSNQIVLETSASDPGGNAVLAWHDAYSGI